MTRREMIIREIAAATVFALCMILPATFVGIVTYFVLSVIINIIHKVYF